VSVANQRSTWLSQDAEVGVKWTWNLGLRANQDLIARGLVRPVVVHHEVDVQLGRDAGLDGSQEPQELCTAMPAVQLADDLARCDIEAANSVVVPCRA
jgi:hypothetical protein